LVTIRVSCRALIDTNFIGRFHFIELQESGSGFLVDTVRSAASRKLQRYL